DLVATAERAVRQALSGLSGSPDLVCFFICGDDPDDVTRAGVRAMAMARRAGADTHVIGCSSTGVIGGGRGIEVTPAVSAWAATLDKARIIPFALETLQAEDRFVVIGLPERDGEDRAA